MEKRKMRILCIICVFIMLLTSIPDIGISRTITANAAPSYNVIAAVNYGAEQKEIMHIKSMMAIVRTLFHNV